MTDRSIGRAVVEAIFKVNPLVGNGVGYNGKERIKNYKAVEYEDQTVELWDEIGKAIVNTKFKVKEIRIYDGSNKRDGQPHLDHFIPESEMHETADPDYSNYERNKEDVTPIPGFDSVDQELDTVTEGGGYRVIIKDSDVKKDTLILYSIVALDRGEENNLPSDYTHVSPGATYIINQKSNEWQLFFERKSCYKIRYMVIDPEDIDKPEVVVFSS